MASLLNELSYCIKMFNSIDNFLVKTCLISICYDGNEYQRKRER